MGRCRGGLTTKIVALVDALGNLVRFVLLPGQRHDTLRVAPLIADGAFCALLGDKAVDVGWLRAELDSRGAPRSSRPSPTGTLPSSMTRPCIARATSSRTSLPG